MRSNLKKSTNRKEQSRHRLPAVMTYKHVRPAESPTRNDSSSEAQNNSQPQIKGKDIDLLNYTDL